MNPLALEDPHEYEDISKYNGKLPSVPEGSAGELSVIPSPCPLYIPTTWSAAPLEAEYEQVSVPAGGSVQGQGSLARSVGSGSGEPEDHRSQPEYENVNALRNQKPHVMEPEYEAVSVEETA
jgi:hypothetical protein